MNRPKNKELIVYRCLIFFNGPSDSHSAGLQFCVEDLDSLQDDLAKLNSLASIKIASVKVVEQTGYMTEPIVYEGPYTSECLKG